MSQLHMATAQMGLWDGKAEDHSNVPLSVSCRMFRPLRLADSNEVYFARFVQLRAPGTALKYSLVGAFLGILAVSP